MIQHLMFEPNFLRTCIVHFRKTTFNAVDGSKQDHLTQVFASEVLGKYTYALPPWSGTT